MQGYVSQYVTVIGQGSYPRNAIEDAHKELDTAWRKSEFFATDMCIILATTMTNTEDGYHRWIFTITCEFRGTK